MFYSRIKKFDTTNLFWLGLFLLIIPYIFWFYLGEDSFVLILDNLDHEFVYIKILLESENLFSFDFQGKIPAMMNGLPRYVFRSGWNLAFVIFYILPAIYAYITHHFVVHLVGYLGMFLLLKKYFIKKNHFLILIISLCFGFVPYYHIQFGISISGQPLLLFALLNFLYNKSRWYDWLVVVVFPFFSFLVITLPFYIPFMILIGLWYIFKFKKFPINYFIAITLLCLINILVEFPILYSMFFEAGFVSQRTEWQKYYMSNFESISQFFYMIKTATEHTNYHSGSFRTNPIIYALFITVIILKGKINRTIIIVVSVLVFIIIWDVVNQPLMFHLSQKISFLKTFHSQRFIFLLPFLWLLLLAILLEEFNWKNYLQLTISIVLLFFTFKGIIRPISELNKNYDLLSNKTIEVPTFRQFYDHKLFEMVKNNIGEENISKFNFLCVGFPPNILHYNGLRTLDSYQNNYPLSYKHEFRKIISKELDKNTQLKDYYDKWGSRCYGFSSELMFNLYPGKDDTASVYQLEFDMEQAKAMNGKYIIAAVPILNFKEAGIYHLGSFEHADSYWKFYLYEIQ